ncbi:hypothetical protein BGM09_28220 [Streptomyces sp. CBMA29]|nr:hypothetical protein [Streptomyces sp. CBMA29]
MYPGDGSGDFGTRRPLNRPSGSPSADWSQTTAVISVGDVDGDGLGDLWTRNRSTGVLTQYLNDAADPQGPGAPLGRGGNRTTIGSGFNGSTPGVAAVGDADGDGHPDLWATWTSDDHLHFYAGAGYPTAPRGFAAPVDASGGGWTSVIDAIS